MYARLSSDAPRGATILVTRLVQHKRDGLLYGRIRMMICGRALPLNFAEARPFTAALERNIEAALQLRTFSFRR